MAFTNTYNTVKGGCLATNMSTKKAREKRYNSYIFITAQLLTIREQFHHFYQLDSAQLQLNNINIDTNKYTLVVVKYK